MKNIIFLIIGFVATILFSGILSLFATLFPIESSARSHILLLLHLALFIGSFTASFYSQKNGIRYGVMLACIFMGVTLFIGYMRTETIEYTILIPLKLALSAFGGWAGEQCSKIYSKKK